MRQQKADVHTRVTAVLLSAALAAPLTAQSTRLTPMRPSPERSVAVFYRTLDFRYTGDDTTAASLDFDDAVLGVRVTIPGWREKLVLSLGFGNQPRGADSTHPELHFLDVEGLAWADLRLAGRRQVQLLLTGVIVIDYRRFGIGSNPAGVDAQPQFHGAIGGGLALKGRLGPRVVFDARSAPLVGVTFLGPEDGGFPPLNLLWESDVSLRWERVFADRVGIVAGASLRVASWHVPAEKEFPSSTDKWYPYDSTEPAIRLGISW